jgi:hypothetical protein
MTKYIFPIKSPYLLMIHDDFFPKYNFVVKYYGIYSIEKLEYLLYIVLKYVICGFDIKYTSCIPLATNYIILPDI